MDVCDIGRTPYYAFPTVYTLASSASDEISANKTVEINTDYNLLGQCTLVGIVDTGIDYQHPAFRNADGSTRIVSLWDQTDQSPSGGGNCHGHGMDSVQREFYLSYRKTD